MFKISILLIGLFSIASCGDTESDIPCPNAEVYTMSNFVGLDGCGWMLVQGDQSYEIINMMDHFDTFEEGREVEVELIPRTDMASICMAGIISEITCKL